MTSKTASILYITDNFCEKNQEDLIKNELNILKYVINKITVLPEIINLICDELERLIKYSDFVLIIGGVKNGVVYQSLAKATGQDLIENPELKNYLEKNPKGYQESEVIIPQFCKIYFPSQNNDFIYPIVYCQRIFVIKEGHEISVPQILSPHLSKYGKEKKFRKTIKSIVPFDRNSLKNNGVKIEHLGGNNVFQIVSDSFGELVEFEDKLTKLGQFSSKSVIEDWDSICSSRESHLLNAIENIKKCLNLYKGPQNVFVSFNGGKDCTVLLHLILSVINTHFSNFKSPILCLYVQSSEPFPEQEIFIHQCEKYYNLEVITIQSDIKTALGEILGRFPQNKACFMGTRRTDPYSSEMEVFQMTDDDWPQIMRVSPLLDWHYSDIWDYLLFYKVPYCELYDMGFTSLGNTVNTTKNPSLAYYDVIDEKEKYLPAYKLLKETKERHGRNNKNR